MKRLIALFAIAGMLTMGMSLSTFAQKPQQPKADKEQAVDTAKKVDTASTLTPAAPGAPEAPKADKPFHQVLKQKFIEGGAGWMAPILLCLIIGLGLSIERILYLSLATTNAQKLLQNVENALKSGGIESAKELCRNTRGPLASIFYQGLDRYDEGLDIVEKSVVAYGGVQMARLENNLSWIGLFIAMAPMLGFLGTVVGMVQAFDAIEAAGDISPTVVASGMKVALLTTVFGLITAIIIQILYNYILSKIDSIVGTMEDATITFMDILVKYKK